MIDALENIEEGLSIQYLEFLTKSFEKYLNSKNYFLDNPMINKEEILNIEAIRKFLELKPFTTLNNLFEKGLLKINIY